MSSFSSLQYYYPQAGKFISSASNFVYPPCTFKRPIYITALDTIDFCQIISTLYPAKGKKKTKTQSKFDLITPPSKPKLEELWSEPGL